MCLPNDSISSGIQNSKWGFWGTLLWGLLIAILYTIVQVVVFIIYSQVVLGGITEEFMRKIEYNGTALSLATFATMIICGLAVLGVIKLKKHSNLKEYLAINRVSLPDMRYWIVVVIVLLIAMDTLTYLLGKPIVVEFMTAIYNSTSHHWLLFLALIVAAPVFEELFFRGFLLSGLSETFLRPIGATIVTSLVWAAIHVQYDFYVMLLIFFMGIVLATARLKTNSILTTIIMHAIMNLVSTIETIIYVS
jgi:membrane protease YdiL (CAAX protease family)